MFSVNFDISGQVAAITGAGGIICGALAKEMAKKGVKVALLDLFVENAQKIADEIVAEGGEAIAVKADVLDRGSLEAARDEVIAKYGKVDILVNNAGVSLIKQIQDTTKAEIDDLFSVNVIGAILCSREAAKSMISEQSGLIVNISSVWGEVGASCESVYSASKGALISFTKALAKELGWSGIRVNCVSPGVIDTKMNGRFSTEEKAALVEEIPVGRMGKAEEIASAVIFLEENGYVTGVDLPVNGGFSIV